MRLTALVLAVAAFGLPIGIPSAARAQGDWSITREREPPRRPARGRSRRARPQRRPDGDRGGRDRSEALIERYRRVLDSNPTDAFALRRLLDLYRERDGNTDAFVEELEKQREDDEEAYGPRLILGQVHELSQRVDEARTVLEEAASLRPKAPAPKVALARIHREAGELDRARELLEEALDHTRSQADRRERFRDLGEIALEQEDYDAARRYYDRLTRGAKGSTYERTEYARALDARGEHDRAVDEYQRVLRKLGGDNRVLPPVLRDMGRAQLEAGRADEAIETLERALRLAPARSGIRREIYDVLVEAHRRTSRLQELADRLEREGRDFELLELLGRVHDELGNEDEALEAYRRALRLDRRHIDTRMRVVQLLSRSGRLDEVIDEYRKLIRIAPNEPRFVVELAQLFMQVGRRDEAMRLAERTSRRYPRDPAVHRALAELYGQWGEDERATREIRTLVRIDPRDPSHLIELGAQQLAEGDRKAALATWRRILATDPDKAHAHATLGGVLADHDMLAEAEEAYREAVRREPDELDYVRGLANVLERPRKRELASERQARDAEAIELWTRVVELAEDDRAARREARSHIVGIAARRDELSRRMAQWKRRFEEDPPDLDAGRFLADGHLRQRPRQLDAAEAVLERIVEHAPGDVGSLAELERVRTAQGDLVGAIEVLRKLVEADPRKAPAYLQRMAEHALSLYRDDEAVEYAERAVRRSPDDASVHRRLGDLYRSRQDVDAAVRSYRRAIEIDERSFPTYFDLAELHLARGELQKADRLLRQVMRASPDDDLVGRAARSSIQINLGAGTLDELEQDLLPLALSHPSRPIYRRLVVELYDAMTRPWIRAVQEGGGDAKEARQGLEALGRRAVKPLLEALGDDDPAQRRIAVSVLGHLGNPNAAGPLLAAAEEQGASELRARALAAAGALADPSLAPRFVELAEGPERRLRAMAAWSLARMGGRRAVGAMRELLDHADPSVRAFASLGLGRAGDAASAEELAALLREDRNIYVQAAAAWSLGELEARAHVSALVRALGGAPGPVSRAAVRALGRLGGTEARAALTNALFDADAAQRRAAARALSALASDTASADRTGRFPVPNPAVSAADYIVERTVPEGPMPTAPMDLEVLEDHVVRAASEALQGPVEQVSAALQVLAPRQGEAISLGPLTSRMGRWPEPRQVQARRVLTGVAKALAPDLVVAARHPEPDVRKRAVALLGGLPGAGPAKAVAEALEDEESAVQRAALRGLADEHAREVPGLADRVAPLLREHPEWSVRMEAAKALGRLGAEEGVAALSRALRDDRYAFVREAAARALGQMGATEARGALERARERDPEERVRRVAAEALDGASAD
ncbi:MAG: HEAT repeat domain-containing protein [Myxococcota bacterium]